MGILKVKCKSLQFQILLRKLTLSLFLLAFLCPSVAYAERDDSGYNGYSGPRQLSASQTNVTGGCNCGSGGGGGGGGGGGSTLSGGAGNAMLAFAPILGAYVLSVVTDSEGNVEEVIYENVVAVVEMERVGNDYYVNVTEVRSSDVNSFISNQNQPDNVYQVIMADDYLEAEGGADNTSFANGNNVSVVQAMELPPEDTYENMFFVEPGGNVVSWSDYMAGAEELGTSAD